MDKHNVYNNAVVRDTIKYRNSYYLSKLVYIKNQISFRSIITETDEQKFSYWYLRDCRNIVHGI